MMMPLAKFRKRQSQRGALAIEGLIVAMLLVGVLSGTLYLQRVFVAKWQTLQQSRAGAWSHALRGCGSDGPSQLYASVHEDSRQGGQICSNPEDCQGESVDGLAGDGLSNPPSWFPQVRGEGATASREVRSLAGAPFELRTQREFSCNERPSGELQLGSSGAMDGVANMARRIVEEQVDPVVVGRRCERRVWSWKRAKWRWIGTPCNYWGKDAAKALGLWQEHDLEIEPPEEYLLPR